jgi:hypothetical protein
MSISRDCAAERGLLREIQFVHAQELRSSGVLAVALRAAGLTVDDEPPVAISRVRRDNTPGLEVVETSIRIELPTPGEYKRAPVVETVKGLSLPIPPFDDMAADMVLRFAEGMEEMRLNGILPHLTPNLDAISDPSMAITVMRREDIDN